jgi:hypothetical protein
MSPVSFPAIGISVLLWIILAMVICYAAALL